MFEVIRFAMDRGLSSQGVLSASRVESELQSMSAVRSAKEVEGDGILECELCYVQRRDYMEYRYLYWSLSLKYLSQTEAPS